MENKEEIKKIIKKLKKCLPLKNLKLDITDVNNMDEESLKKYVSCYDLNPEVNYCAFTKIPNYKDFLDKYKYTLNYDDAKKLGCFNEINEDNIIRGINNKIKDLNLNVKELIAKDIKSLSKLKIIDFFLHLFTISLNKKNFQEILVNIKKYKLNIIFIFKNCINSGNIELKYYFFYELFVELFLYNVDDKKKIEPQNFLSTKLEYFPTVEKECDAFCEVDLTEFEKRKAQLMEYEKSKTKNKEIIKEKNEPNKEKIIELDENLEENINVKSDIKKVNKGKKEDNKKGTKSFEIFDTKLSIFNGFKEVIIQNFFKENDDEKIIKAIKFIYYYIVLGLNNNDLPDEKLIRTFNFKNDKDKIAKIKDLDTNNKLEKFFGFGLNDLISKNIKCSHSNFLNKFENPFIDNYLCYPFPTFLHKNYLEFYEDIYNDFLDYLKYIYKSSIMQDIYYLCEEFDGYEYPLMNDDILNEMFQNTYYIPFESESLNGFTQKNLISIFIPVINKNNTTNKLECFINQLGFLLNTTIHEQLKHYIKAVIFFNSFRFGEKKHIESDGDLENPENKYLEALLMKIKNKKKNYLKGKDGGHTTEIYLYGGILDELTALQSLKMFQFSTWETSIFNHANQFINNYKDNISNLNLSDVYLDLNNILENKEFCPFIKNILKKFIKYNEIDKGDIFINTNFISKKTPETDDENMNQILININYKEKFKRSNVRDCAP